VFILLLSGFVQLDAYNQAQDSCYSSGDNSKESANASYGNLNNLQGFIAKSSSSSFAGKRIKIDVEEKEIEEDELVCTRKYTAISEYFNALFDPQTAGYFFHYLKKRLPFCKHFSFFSSDWCLNTRFQVFRI
jgi:hypothetical protein